MITVGSATQYVNRKKDELGAAAGQARPTMTMQANPQASSIQTWKPPVNTTQPGDVGPNGAGGPNGQAGINPSQPQDGAFHSTAGDNVTNYVNRTSGTLGQDPGYTTDAGRLYADQVTKGLQGPDASSVNAQNTEDTAASRRNYMARMQSGEAIGQSGFGAGTAQAQRIQDQSQAGVDLANQNGQNSVNAYLRQRTEDNMNRAKGLESDQYNKGRNNLADAQNQDLTQYGRSEKATDRGLAAAAVTYQHGRDTVGDTQWNTVNAQNQAQQGVQNQQWNTTNQQNQTQQAVTNSQWSTLNGQQQKQLAIENAVVAKGSDDTAKRNLLAGLPDGPAKNKVMAGLADGSLTIQNAIASVMNTDGTIKDEYAGSTPGALGLKAETEYAQQTVDLQDPTLKTTNPQKYVERVNAEILAKRQAENNPINKATEGQALDDARKALATGGTLDQKAIDALKTSGDIASYDPKNLPIGADNRNLIGKTVSIGNDAYKVTDNSYERTSWDYGGGGTPRARHTDFAEITSMDGKSKKYVYNGAIHDSPPKAV